MFFKRSSTENTFRIVHSKYVRKNKSTVEGSEGFWVLVKLEVDYATLQKLRKIRLTTTISGK